MPILRNQTRYQQTFNLSPTRSATLMPFGSLDSAGPSDCVTVTDVEAKSVEVQNALRQIVPLVELLPDPVKADVQADVVEEAPPPSDKRRRG